MIKAISAANNAISYKRNNLSNGQIQSGNSVSFGTSTNNIIPHKNSNAFRALRAGILGALIMLGVTGCSTGFNEKVEVIDQPVPTAPEVPIPTPPTPPTPTIKVIPTAKVQTLNILKILDPTGSAFVSEINKLNLSLDGSDIYFNSATTSDDGLTTTYSGTSLDKSGNKTAITSAIKSTGEHTFTLTLGSGKEYTGTINFDNLSLSDGSTTMTVKHDSSGTFTIATGSSTSTAKIAYNDNATTEWNNALAALKPTPTPTVPITINDPPTTTTGNEPSGPIPIDGPTYPGTIKPEPSKPVTIDGPTTTGTIKTEPSKPVTIDGPTTTGTIKTEPSKPVTIDGPTTTGTIKTEPSKPVTIDGPTTTGTIKTEPSKPVTIGYLTTTGEPPTDTGTPTNTTTKATVTSSDQMPSDTTIIKNYPNN